MWRKSDEAQAGGPGGGFNYSGGTAVLPAREVQHAWFELTRARPWKSLALVAVEDHAATLGLAHDMAQMAALDPRNRVLVINATGEASDEPVAPAAAPASGAQVFGGAGGAQAVASGKYWLLDCARLGMDEATIGMVEAPKHLDQLRAGTGPYTMIIAAVTSLVARPASVATARSMDAVVLCPTLGRSSFADARRSLELVGEESVIGSIAIRPRA